MQGNNLEALLKAQARVLNSVASGQPLDVCLDTICLEIESLSVEGAKASILILQGDRLVYGAGPSLPVAYQEAINGVEIGDNVGSCGTAAFLKQPVYVDDIASSVQWQDFSQLAAKYRLKACWSTPIMSSKGKVLGTFAIYFDHVKKPEKHHLDLIVFFHSLTALTIERDLLYQRKTELSETIQSHANKLQAFARVMPDLAFVMDEDGNYVDIFGADEKLLYDELSKLIGVSLSDVFDEEHTRQYMSVIHTALRTEEVQEYEYTLVVPKGEIVFEARVAPIDNYDLSNKEKRHVLWMARDITDRKLNEMEIEKLAFFDPLTGLPNRRLLIDRLNEVIKKSNRNDEVSALIFMDLDNFKGVNDSLGHSGGDRVLQHVASKLQYALRETDTLARIGGDEFVILLECFEEEIDKILEEANQVCDRILEILSEPVKVDEHKIITGASLGVSLIEGSHITADSILGRADVAMYKAKNTGKGRACFHKD